MAEHRSGVSGGNNLWKRLKEFKRRVGGQKGRAEKRKQEVPRILAKGCGQLRVG